MELHLNWSYFKKYLNAKVFKIYLRLPQNFQSFSTVIHKSRSLFQELFIYMVQPNYNFTHA